MTMTLNGWLILQTGGCCVTVASVEMHPENTPPQKGKREQGSTKTAGDALQAKDNSREVRSTLLKGNF